MISSLQFGNFTSVCQEVFIPPCALWTPAVLPTCDTSTTKIGSANVRGLGEMLISAVGLILMFVIVYRTHTKYAAVGRKEMIILFVFFILIFGLQIGTLTNLAANGTPIKNYLVSIHIGLVIGFFWVLLMNGIVGYQLVEDGGPLSFFGILISGIVMTVLGTVFSVDVANPLGINISPSPNTSIALFVLYLIFPVICVLGYVVLQTVLVAKNLGDQKPLVSLYISLVLFIVSQLMLFVLNQTTCKGTSNSVSGTLFSILFNLGAMVFVYRFWDSITEDDWDNIDDIFV